MREVRRRFHEELHALEGEVQQTGRQAQLLLERALQALARGDPAVCDEVIRGDDEVDQLYLDAERRILGLLALQTPVASDLRLLTALLHINLHLERIADQAVEDDRAEHDRRHLERPGQQQLAHAGNHAARVGEQPADHEGQSGCSGRRNGALLSRCMERVLALPDGCGDEAGLAGALSSVCWLKTLGAVGRGESPPRYVNLFTTFAYYI